MKPLNYNKSPCTPTSSNCVIWQGPDLNCIKLCKGDTISDVTANLANELCNVMDELSITNYDLSCFDLVGCNPKTYQELLQFLIDKICELYNLPETTINGEDNKDLINVAPCFVVNGVTVMTLTDYVIAIGLRICSIIDQIAEINNILIDYGDRITVLEEAVPPTFTIPTVASDCILQNSPQIGGLGSPAVPMDQLLSVLINDNDYGYCALINATGLPINIINSVLSQCIFNTDIPLSPTTGATYSANPNWNSNWQTPDTNIAASLSNIWVVLCDIYNSIGSQTGVTITETNCTDGIANNADVYGYIDTTSGPYSGSSLIAGQNKATVCQALYNWYNTYVGANPGYTGQLYIYQSSTENYLNHPNIIKTGTSGSSFIWLNPLDGTTTGAVVPPGYGPSWACSDAMLFVAFVNESDPIYHGSVSPPSLVGQPTSTTPGWTTDFNLFVSDYTTFWTSFNAVIYPAYEGASAGNDNKNFLLHAYGATNNVDISLAGLSGAFGGNYTIANFGLVAVGPGSNPYTTTSQGLWNYGWGSILDKSVDSAGLLTFTEAEFANDLNSLLGGAGDCDTESIIESWDPISQSLVLRQITSCCLDLSITSEGCLSIECPTLTQTVVDAGTGITVVSNIVGNTTTYTVSTTSTPPPSFPNTLFSVSKDPGNLNSALSGIVTPDDYEVCNGQIQIFSGGQITSNEFGSAYNSVTGVFTIPADGTYALTFAIQYSLLKNFGASGWNDGGFTAGIVSNTGCITYCANNHNNTTYDTKALYVSGAITLQLFETTELCLKVINLTNDDYLTSIINDDYVRWSVYRIR